MTPLECHYVGAVTKAGTDVKFSFIFKVSLNNSWCRKGIAEKVNSGAFLIFDSSCPLLLTLSKVEAYEGEKLLLNAMCLTKPNLQLAGAQRQPRAQAEILDVIPAEERLCLHHVIPSSYRQILSLNMQTYKV